MTTPGESNTNIGNLDELAERLGNFRESVRALADCLHSRDITRQTDLSMIEAAKHMYHKLLEKASDDLERVTPQTRESLHAEATRNKRRCPRPETSNEKSCPRAKAPSERPCSPAETLVETPCSRSRDSETISPSRGPLEQVRYGEWKYEFKMSKLTTTILNLLFAEAGQKGRTRTFRAYIGPGSDGSSADKLSLDLKFNPWDTAISFRLESHPMSKTVFTQYDPSESWCTEQKDAWLDDVKTFCHRPIRCLTVVHPYFLAHRDTDLLVESAHLSCARKKASTSHMFRWTR